MSWHNLSNRRYRRPNSERMNRITTIKPKAGQEGAYAEKIAIKAAIVAKKPTGLSHVEATAVALTGLTALSAIEDTLNLKPDLKELALRNGMEIRHASFQDDMNRLIRGLKGQLDQAGTVVPHSLFAHPKSSGCGSFS
jgi:hypothetical protein